MGESYCPAWMNGGEKYLTQSVAEQSADSSHAWAYPPKTVAVAYDESFSVDGFIQNAVDHSYAEFRRKIVEYPDVVVADNPRHLHPGGGYSCDKLQRPIPLPTFLLFLTLQPIYQSLHWTQIPSPYLRLRSHGAAKNCRVP